MHKKHANIYEVAEGLNPEARMFSVYLVPLSILGFSQRPGVMIDVRTGDCKLGDRRLREGFPNFFPQKMEIFNGICHEGGELVSSAFKVVSIFLLKNHLESLPDCQNAFCTKFELYIMYI